MFNNNSSMGINTCETVTNIIKSVGYYVLSTTKNVRSIIYGNSNEPYKTELYNVVVDENKKKD